jgi:hypothetical protein
MTVSAVARAFSPPPADHPIYNLVGRVASEMAHLEHILDLTIADLAQTDSEIIACVTASMLSPYARFQAIQSLALKRGASEAVIENIEQEASKTNNIAKRRNRVVHDAWFVDQDNITAQA